LLKGESPSSFFVATLAFAVADLRLYLPLCILLIAVAVLPATWAARNLLAGRRSVIALGIFVLFAATCVGYPSRSGYNEPDIKGSHAWASQAWDVLHFDSPLRQSSWFIAQDHFLKDFGWQSGVVLSDNDPVYLDAFLPRWIVAAPLDGQHRYMHSRIWPYRPAEALALVKRGSNESHALYALFASRREMEKRWSDCRTLTVMNGFWQKIPLPKPRF